MDGVAMEVFSTIRAEFSDIPDASELTRVLLRLTIAVVLGGLIGYEREAKGKAAGLRTHMLVSLGSALFVLVPLQAGVPMADISRVLQGIASGIGFLGAGAIIKYTNEDNIQGLTTAASIWMVAAIGVAAGIGREATAVIATIFTLVILAILQRIKEESGVGDKARAERAEKNGKKDEQRDAKPDDRATDRARDKRDESKTEKNARDDEESEESTHAGKE